MAKPSPCETCPRNFDCEDICEEVVGWNPLTPDDIQENYRGEGMRMLCGGTEGYRKSKGVRGGKRSIGKRKF